MRLMAEHISLTEKNSSDAERDSKEVKLYAYLEAQMRARKPQPYAALVTDVRNFGFFVDVPDLGLSGAVPLSAIPDDFFLYDQARGQLMGRRTRRIIQMGDRVTVCIYRIDRYKKQVDFQLVQPSATPRSFREDRRPDGERKAPPPERGSSLKKSKPNEAARAHSKKKAHPPQRKRRAKREGF